MKPKTLYPETSMEEDFEEIISRYEYILFPAAVTIALILFIWLCFVAVGFSATESGLVHNHLTGVI